MGGWMGVPREGAENGDADDAVVVVVVVVVVVEATAATDAAYRAVTGVATGDAEVAPVTTTDSTPIIGARDIESASSHVTR